MKLLIKGGTVINPATGFEGAADVLISDGVIEAVGTDLKAAGATVYDAAGMIVAPGLIDMHVHLREPGQEAKEDIATGTRAAAVGGFTTVATMPNTRPVIDSAILVAGVIKRAEEVGVVKVKVIGAISKGQEGKELSEIGDMLGAGAVAISDDGKFLEDARLMRNAMDYASMFDCPIISHAEEDSLAGDGFMHEGVVSAKLGLRGRPAVAEDIAVSRDIMLAEYLGASIHIAHVSTKGAVELVRQAKARGVQVTAEATPHHLILTDEAVTSFHTATKVNPPLRSEDHVTALIEGICDGTIDAIATDHAPHAQEEKDMEFRYAPSGMIGLETALGLMLTHFVHKGKLTMLNLVKLMSYQPAKILKLDGGRLEAGCAGDVVIIDPQAEWTVNAANMQSRGKNTPFDGWRLMGKAKATFVNGKMVMENGEVTV